MFTHRKFSLLSFVLLMVLLVGISGSVLAVSGAGFTTTNNTDNGGPDAPGHCKNGNELVNCNIYDGKEFVWMNGGPVSASLGDGTYFFAVLVPGGQGGNENPNDGTPKNLSDDYDAYTNRTFSLSGGIITTYAGSHDFNNNKIRLMPYDDTTNPGGVYIMAICNLAGGYPVTPSDCKYDAFKIKQADTGTGEALSVAKTASGAYKNSFTWTIAKAVDKTLVKQVGGTATFTYTVTVTHSAGVISDVKVSGTITVTNPNLDDVTGVDVSDSLPGGTCSVTNGTGQTLPSGDTDFAYSCNLAGLPQSPIENTVTVSWPAQDLLDGPLAAGSDSYSTGVSFAETKVDDCVDVTDSFNGGPNTKLGTVCVTDANPTTFQYSRTVSVPQFDCVSYTNTAAFKTDDTGATGSASQTVTVCGPAKTGALTMGFWQNKNGQAIIKGGAATAGVCNSGTWLRQFKPFQDLSATATCAQVAAYDVNIFNAANAAGTSMNPMLKAQMLATAFDVYFSDPSLGGNKIGAPAGKPLGGVLIDLTKVCKNISTCSIYENVSGSFGGATSMKVIDMLLYQNNVSNVGGSVWYAQVKATQEKAKDAFDAINNQVAFSA